MEKIARILVDNSLAAFLTQHEDGCFSFKYLEGYKGESVSLTLPMQSEPHEFKQLPSFFEGLLPEGLMLEALLRKYKIDKNDLFEQLLVIGQDVVGNISVEKIK